MTESNWPKDPPPMTIDPKDDALCRIADALEKLAATNYTNGPSYNAIAKMLADSMTEAIVSPALRIADALENSWLKAALFDDPARYVPGPVEAVQELIGEDLPTLDEALTEALLAALSQPNATAYQVAKPEAIEPFLRQHAGQRLFTVSW